MTNAQLIYVLTNPPGVGVGLPLGVYSAIALAQQAAVEFGNETRIQQLVLDAPADYAAAETVG